MLNKVFSVISDKASSIYRENWGIIGTSPVSRFRLVADNGAQLGLSDYGATVLEVRVPDRDSKMGDVSLHYDTLEETTKQDKYLGGTCGRCANRIAKGQFTLNKQLYQLAINNGPNSLHGGIEGFDKRIWTAETNSNQNAVVFKRISPDGEEKYPGNLKVRVKIQWLYNAIRKSNILRFEYKASSDKDTIANLINHWYPNLTGQGFNSSILGHQLAINADYYTPTDDTNIPYGILARVENTPFDFRVQQLIGARITQDNEQLKFGNGYDHNYVINRKTPGEFVEAAFTFDPISGRAMRVSTTEWGVQLYSGNYLAPIRTGFCLETQNMPDAIHNIGLCPSPIYGPTADEGKPREYNSVTEYEFFTMK